MLNNQGSQSKLNHIGNNGKRFDQLEIKPISNIAKFNQMLQVWKEYDIPDCHKKYYYNVLLEHKEKADELIRIEIESITNNKSVVRTLHQLTIGRERCLKEIQKQSKGNFQDFLKIISKFIYHLRKLTLNLMEFHRKWRNSLNQKFEQNYVWEIKDSDYLHQIKEDHKIIQNHHPKTKDYFQLKDDDIFYLNVVLQAEKDQEDYEHLIIHKMDKKYIEKMKDLQEYFNTQIKDYKHINFGMPSPCNRNQDINHVGSLGILNRNINMTNFVSEVIYNTGELQFHLVKYPFKDLQGILENWTSQNVQELNDSFKYPINHITDLLKYWQEALILRIDKNGLIICSIDQEQNQRRWIIHQIYLNKEPMWQQRFNVVIQHFIKMLIQRGDPFTSLAVCCSNDQPIKKLLGDLKFTVSKKITYNEFNVVIYDQKVQNLQQMQQNLNRQYFTPLTLRMLRIYANQLENTLITNEELLIAQYCANLGKNTIIKFEKNILELSPQLNKSKLYGQDYMLIQKPNDVKTKYQIEFNTPIKSPVYFQQFNVRLNFKFFSSEIHQNNNQSYLRLISNPNLNEQEPSILQLSSSEIMNSTIYLISTIDPFIKIFIQEVQPNQISKQNIQSVINQSFETFDKKQECLNHLWLPQFKCCGKQIKLSDAIIEAYFQNDTYLSVQYPRNSSLHNNKYFSSTDKLIQTPFLFGIVQSDLEKINKPLFSILINKEHLIKISDKTINNNKNSLPNSIQLQPQETESTLIQLFKNSPLEIQKSFCSNPTILSNKLKYSLECSLIKFNVGYALVYVDENHIQEKRWIIESIMINDLNNLSSLLSNLVQYLFTIDHFANEIQISQTHYAEQGELIANTFIMNSIKNAKFRWRLVDNDAKTQIRKTIYFLKRSISEYPNKMPNEVSIQFKSYYATQQSEERNQIINHLQYIHSPNQQQFFEDCFQYHVHGQVPDSNQLLYKKIQSIQGKLPNSEFSCVHSWEELQSQIKFQIDRPTFDNKFKQYDILYMNTQLQIKKQRQVIYQNQKYLEIPNSDTCKQIYQSDNQELNQKIYFVATQDPLYFAYFIELGNPQLKQQIQQDQVRIATQVSQAFLNKYFSNHQLMWIQQFQKITPIEQDLNFLYINFALNSQFSIEQSLIMEDEMKNQQEIYKIKLPIFCGLLNTNMRTQFERPLIGMIIE